MKSEIETLLLLISGNYPDYACAGYDIAPRTIWYGVRGLGFNGGGGGKNNT